MPTDAEYMAMLQQAQSRKKKNQNMLSAYASKGADIFSTVGKIKDALSSLYSIAESPGFYNIRSIG